MHNNGLVNFTQSWNKVVNDLQALSVLSNFSSNDFRRFIRIITGVWCMHPYKKRSYMYKNDDSSAPLLRKHNDGMIKHAVFTSDMRSPTDKSKVRSPVADVELCRTEDGFPRCMGMELIYLTPTQKNLYQNIRQTVIRGCAGSGITMLFYMKIIDIMENHSNKNILIIAPRTHHLQINQFLIANSVQTTLCKAFSPPVSGGIVIVTLKQFFDVSPSTLQSYNVSNYHVLIDDLQSLY